MAIAYAVLFFSGLYPVTVFGGEPYFPGPWESADTIAAFFRTRGTAVRICAFLQFGAAIPLGIFAASIVSRLQFFGSRVAGVTIALFGGIATSVTMMAASIALWVMAQPEVAENRAAIQVLYWLVQGLGGAGFSVPFGLLVAGCDDSGGLHAADPKVARRARNWRRDLWRTELALPDVPRRAASGSADAIPGVCVDYRHGCDRTRFARTLFTGSRAEMSEVSGKRLAVAVAVSAGLAVAAGVSAAYGLPAFSPAWGTTDRLATVIVLEAYLAIIVGHLVAFGGLEEVRSRLRIAPTSSQEFGAAAAVWIAIWAAAAVLYFVLSSFAWPITEVRIAMLWIGADGGRLADAEPLLFVLAAGRAILIAPFAEELLFSRLAVWMAPRAVAGVRHDPHHRVCIRAGPPDAGAVARGVAVRHRSGVVS